MPATKEKAPKPKLTLRDANDLLIELNRYIEEHVDEIELNDGALPDDLARLLDEIDAAMADRVDALAAKIDEFTGYATAAKATKDRSARRQKVWENAVKTMKGYGKLQVERNGGEPLKGAVATLRLQRNGQSTIEVALSDTQLHEIAWPQNGALVHKLSQFVKPTVGYNLDTRALAAAYDARRTELEAEAQIIGESDIPWANEQRSADVTPEQVAAALADMRSRYIADNLANEFPGVTVTRGSHLRID